MSNPDGGDVIRKKRNIEGEQMTAGFNLPERDKPLHNNALLPQGSDYRAGNQVLVAVSHMSK